MDPEYYVGVETDAHYFETKRFMSEQKAREALEGIAKICPDADLSLIRCERQILCMKWKRNPKKAKEDAEKL